MINGTSIRPTLAASDPNGPRKRLPTMMATLMMLGPGRNCERESTSVNSRSLSHRCSSTSMRRANGSTPPKPWIPTCMNPTNNARRVGTSIAAVGVSDAVLMRPRHFRRGPRTRDASLVCDPKHEAYDKADHQRDDQARGQRNEESEIFSLDENVARQMAESELGEQRPGKAENDQRRPENDEKTRHGCNGSAPHCSAAGGRGRACGMLLR